MMGKKGCLIALALAALVLSCGLCGAVWLVRPIGGRARPPAVRFQAPVPGQMVRVGEAVSVQGTATSREAKVPIQRLMLWVNGRPQGEQAGPANPLTGTWSWTPEAPGAYTLALQAVDARGRVAAAFQVVQVQPAPDDPDGDGIPNDQDACPEQLGVPQENGCPAPPPDQDGDGVADAEDACPDQAGTPEAAGCPQAGPQDADGDGVADDADTCPNQPGPEETQGCPLPPDADGDGIPDVDDPCPQEFAPEGGCPPAPDEDGDGVPNDLDACPDQAGPAENGGCPLTDADADGIADDVDACPDEAGPPENGGCPLPQPQDTDGDGVADDADMCPDEAGPEENLGCPLSDEDGDGIPDGVDACPDQAGPPGSDGCPHPDTDGDGLPDDQDNCPDLPGPEDNHGCPVSDDDGDAIPDDLDQCPTLPGDPPTGCPAWVQDLQDVVDVLDGMPTLCAMFPNLCNLNQDSDNDGVPDGADNCPDQPGPAFSHGCPIVPEVESPPCPGILPEWVCELSQDILGGIGEEPPATMPSQVEIAFLDPAIETSEMWILFHCSVNLADTGWVPLDYTDLSSTGLTQWHVVNPEKASVLIPDPPPDGISVEIMCWGWRNPFEGEQSLGHHHAVYGPEDLASGYIVTNASVVHNGSITMHVHYKVCANECP